MLGTLFAWDPYTIPAKQADEQGWLRAAVRPDVIQLVYFALPEGWALNDRGFWTESRRSVASRKALQRGQGARTRTRRPLWAPLDPEHSRRFRWIVPLPATVQCPLCRGVHEVEPDDLHRSYLENPFRVLGLKKHPERCQVVWPAEPFPSPRHDLVASDGRKSDPAGP